MVEWGECLLLLILFPLRFLKGNDLLVRLSQKDRIGRVEKRSGRRKKTKKWRYEEEDLQAKLLQKKGGKSGKKRAKGSPPPFLLSGWVGGMP